MNTHVNLEKEFVPYQESFELKELGFDEPCFGYWSNWGTQEPFLLTCELGTEKESCYIRRKNYLCKGPTYSQAFRWFREKHDMKFHIRQDIWNNWCKVKMILENDEYVDIDEYESYEEAELACLRKLIEIVKTKQ